MNSDRCGVGVIGIGIRGQHSYEQILRNDPRMDIVGVSQYPAIRPELLEGQTVEDNLAYARQLNAEYYGEDYAALLERKDVDLICLMCEPDRALELASSCLRAGKHVWRDKPVTRTFEQALELHRLAEQVNRAVILPMPLRHHTALQQVKDYLHQGRLGRILSADMSYLWPNGPLDGFTMCRAYMDAYGGGDMTTAGFHAIDCLNWLLESRPVRVFCEADTFFYDDYRREGAEDFAQLMVTYDNETVASMRVGRLPARAGQYSYLELSGTEGGLEVRRFAPGFRVFDDSLSSVAAGHDPLGELCRQTLDRLFAGKPLTSHAGSGAVVLAVLEAARRSSTTGHPEPVACSSEKEVGI